MFFKRIKPLNVNELVEFDSLLEEKLKAFHDEFRGYRTVLMIFGVLAAIVFGLSLISKSEMDSFFFLFMAFIYVTSVQIVSSLESRIELLETIKAMKARDSAASAARESTS